MSLSAPSLVVLAAGLSTRFGRLKQLEPVGPSGEALLDYAVYDAVRAGIRRVVFIIRESIEVAFREHVSPMIRGGVEVLFVNQAQGDLPEGFDSCKGRSRPWGTAHALWCARHVVDGPLIVINADDFYGRDAYRVLAAALAKNSHCYLVGYALGDTLSDHGGVSRGLIESDSAGWVQTVREARDLRAASLPTAHASAPGDQVIGRSRQGEEIMVSRHDPISMNLWGFPPEILDDLGELFERFLKTEPGPGKEFYLSQALGDLVQMERARCRLLQTNAQWLGITFPEDHAGVVSALAELVAQSEYPGDLNGAWRTVVETP